MGRGGNKRYGVTRRKVRCGFEYKTVTDMDPPLRSHRMASESSYPPTRKKRKEEMGTNGVSGTRGRQESVGI